MKNLFLAIAVILCATLVKAQHKTAKKFITISGQVQFTNPENMAHLNKVWLTKRKGRDVKYYDSATIAPDGKWKLKVDASAPTLYTLDIAKWDRVTIYSDSSMTINSRGYDTAKMKIKRPLYIFIEGSADNNFINLVDHVTYMNYETMIAESRQLYEADKSGDSVWKKYLKTKDSYKRLSDDLKERLKVLIRSYKDRPVVVYALGMLNWEKNQDFIMPVLNGLNKKYPWFKDGREMQKEMEDKIAQAKLLKPGMPIPAVSYPDDGGKLQGFGQYKGKYLLIDFWASWCGPCRAAVPKLKDLYTKYNQKGLELLSISIDENKAAWEKAMKEEAMPWHQWLSPDKNKTMNTFLFSGIPTLYIVDREGKIVGNYTGFSEDVALKIDQLMKG